MAERKARQEAKEAEDRMKAELERQRERKKKEEEERIRLVKILWLMVCTNAKKIEQSWEYILPIKSQKKHNKNHQCLSLKNHQSPVYVVN